MTETDKNLLEFAGDKKYETIYADPPWRFQNRTGKVAPEHKRLNRYETMSLDEIKALPVKEITGDKAHSKYFSDNVYEKIAGPKEEIVVPGATHVDLYDQMDKIPFDRLIAFFDENLK